MSMAIACIGVGGVFYHGLTRMATFCNKRGSDTRVFLIDPDVVEPKNIVRQWGIDIGQPKVNVATEALRHLTGASVVPEQVRIGNGATDNLHTVLGAERLVGVGKILVVSAPDNHMTRMYVHTQCRDISTTGVLVMEIIAGNEADNGYAYGCVFKKGKCYGDWRKRHPDIAQEARREADRLAHPMGCGALMPLQGTEQNMEGNFFTGDCIWTLAEWMIQSGGYGERVWGVQDRGEQGSRIILRSMFRTAGGKQMVNHAEK